MIPVSKVVDVKIYTSPIFPQRKGFGLLLIIGSSNILPVAERIREYADIDGVAADFGTNTEEYKAATAFFQQSPKPTTLNIGRRFTAAVAGEVLGSGNATKDVDLWKAVAAGSFKITFDGGAAKSLAALDFSDVTTLNAVAAKIQAALVTAGVAGAVCTYSGTRFVIRSGTTGEASSVSVASPTGAGTDISAMLGMDADSHPILANGSDAEDATTCLQKMQDYSTKWYGMTFTNHATPQDLLDAAEWAEARVKIFGYSTSDQNVKDKLSVNDVAYKMKAFGYRRTFGIFDSTDPYIVCSAMARAFVVNFNEQNSVITLKFKTLPGQTTELLTVNDKTVLDDKNVNYYTVFGDSAMLAESKMASGVFFDEVHGLDWLQNAIETNVFGFLYTRTTKVPQTDRGMQLLVQQVEKACEDGVNNGLLAPGTWNGDEFGVLKTGDYLKTGYYVYAQPTANQNQSDREARIAPPIQVAGKGSGAIHFASISVSFDR